jgi:hypothetical protein
MTTLGTVWNIRGMANIELGEFSLEKMDRAVEAVRERLHRAKSALERAGAPYAVIGGHAVAAWITRVNPLLVRYTRDVDIVIRRGDFERVKDAFEAAGFISRHSAGIEKFLDGPQGKARDAVHVLFAGEKVRPDDLHPIPDIEPNEFADGYRFASLEWIMQMKLTLFRDKDRTHVRDLLGAGLVYDTWLAKLPADLAARLKQLIDTPHG